MFQGNPVRVIKPPSKETVIYGSILGAVLLVFIVYTSFLIYFTWPVSEFSLNKSGVFGDSFGALTALFSGLAFAGMIVTILLQRNELALQRVELKENRTEFARSASAQETNSKLSALTAVLIEYKAQIVDNEQSLKDGEMLVSDKVLKGLRAEQRDLTRRKDVALKEIEIILGSMGVNFET